jgi:hypothetical protein
MAQCAGCRYAYLEETTTARASAYLRFCCTCVFGVTDNDKMRKEGTGRNPLFTKRWFSDAVIILCVRWYLRFRLSYRDMASIAAELGVSVAPSTILRWVVRYTGEFIRRWALFELVVGRSWRADETYIKVSGGWMYLYRAVDERGRTVASYLSRTRDQMAARTFFRQALKLHGDLGASHSMALSRATVPCAAWGCGTSSTSAGTIRSRSAAASI